MKLSEARRILSESRWDAVIARQPSRVFVEWNDASGQYHGANYKKADLPKLFARLQQQGVEDVTLEEEEEVTLNEALLGESVPSSAVVPGVRLELERVPVLARAQPPAGKVSVKTVAKVKPGRGSDLLIRFEKVWAPGFRGRVLKGFVGTVVNGQLVNVWSGSPGPLKYDVLGIRK